MNSTLLADYSDLERAETALDADYRGPRVSACLPQMTAISADDRSLPGDAPSRSIFFLQALFLTRLVLQAVVSVSVATCGPALSSADHLAHDWLAHHLVLEANRLPNRLPIRLPVRLLHRLLLMLRPAVARRLPHVA